MSCTFSVAATQLWHSSTKAGTNVWMNERGCSPVKLYGYCNWNFVSFSCSWNIIHLMFFQPFKTVNHAALKLSPNRWWAGAGPRATVARPLPHVASKLWSQILNWCLAESQVHCLLVTSGLSKKWGSAVLLSLVLRLLNSKINRNSNIWKKRRIFNNSL